MKHSLQEKFLKIREDFPAICSSPHVYLDSAATAHKPYAVIKALTEFYTTNYSTVHRAVYTSALMATDLYDKAREKVSRFINAASPSEVIFTRGTTDGLNIIADSVSQALLTPHSRILVSEMEHHSNLVPWQLAAKASGATLETLPVTEEGALCLDTLRRLLAAGGITIVAVTHSSNVLGTINPIEEIARIAHEHHAYVIVDGAQAAPHLSIDVKALGCDAYAFSAHKMYGPTGIGVVWAKESFLDMLPPTRGGGDMVDTVTFSNSTWAELPLKFEPGTPPIAEAIAFGTAIDYLTALDIPSIHEYEHALATHLTKRLQAIPNLVLVGTTPLRCPLQAFHVPGAHPLDIATLLNVAGVAVRSGNLCCQPLLKRFSFSSLTRASLAFYNTVDDIDRFTETLEKVLKRF
jgi:cysteine desulfurase/selenocysteine lyase